MKRSEFEHLIRASGEFADDDEIIIIGSQAILGQFPDALQDSLSGWKRTYTEKDSGEC